jgi:hypothetical protein
MPKANKHLKKELPKAKKTLGKRKKSQLKKQLTTVKTSV